MAQLDSVGTQRARQTSNLKAVGSSPTVSEYKNYAREKRERKRERRSEEEEDEREKGRSSFKDGTRSLFSVIDICT